MSDIPKIITPSLVPVQAPNTDADTLALRQKYDAAAVIVVVCQKNGHLWYSVNATEKRMAREAVGLMTVAQQKLRRRVG